MITMAINCSGLCDEFVQNLDDYMTDDNYNNNNNI